MRRSAAPVLVLIAALLASAPDAFAASPSKGGAGRKGAPPAPPASTAPVPASPPALPPAPTAAVAPAPAKGKRMKVAVMDIRPLEGVAESTGKVITELVATEVQALGRYDVISRADVASMLGFQREKTMLGCAEDAACMAEIGDALGTDYVLVGQVATFGTRYRIAISLQDVKKAKVVSRQGSFCERSEDALAAATQEAVSNIFREVESGGQLPPPVVKTRPAAPVVAPTSPVRSAGWITGSAGLAALLAAGTFDYLGYAAYKDEKRAAAAGDAAATESFRSTSLARRRTAQVLYAGGTLALGTGAVLYFVGAPKAPVAVGVHPLPGGALAAISGRFP